MCAGDGSDLRRRQILLTDVHAPGSRHARDVGAIVDDDGRTEPRGVTRHTGGQRQEVCG